MVQYPGSCAHREPEPLYRRAHQGADHPFRLKRLSRRNRGGAQRPPGGHPICGDRPAGRRKRGRHRLRAAHARLADHRRRAGRLCGAKTGLVQTAVQDLRDPFHAGKRDRQDPEEGPRVAGARACPRRGSCGRPPRRRAERHPPGLTGSQGRGAAPGLARFTAVCRRRRGTVWLARPPDKPRFSHVVPLDILPSVCPHDCPSTCALEVERLDAHTIGRIRGAASNSYTAGVVCAKVARYAERQHHPERLRVPLRRIGDKGVGRAAFEEISWDAALDAVAEEFTKAVQRHGSEAVWPYYYAGTMGLVQRDGINRLRHVMGYSRQFSTICVMLADTGWNAGAGVKRGVDSREMAESDLIVVWGGNPVSTQVNLMAHVAKARKNRGAKLVVIDPYRTPTAEVADFHLAVRPGTDPRRACAVMHVLFKEGYADRAYLAKYTDVPDELEAHLATRDPAWAARITGLSEQAISEFARLYGRTRRSFIRIGYGFSRSRNGSAQLFAATCLPAVTVAWQYRGGGALYGSSAIYPLHRTLIEGLDLGDPRTRLLDQSRIRAVLTRDKHDLGDGPPVTAMLVQNTNPMDVATDTLRVRYDYHRDDLIDCVHVQFMTEAADMADIVLPATTFLEHDDIYTASCHTHLQVARKIVEPEGQCRTNHDVICALARRLGAEHRGFAMSESAIVEETLTLSGLPGTAGV